MKKSIVLAVAALSVAALSCAHQRPLTTVHAESANVFWCAPRGECFTEEDRCRTLGDCLRSTEAWCSRGSMGGYRFVCGSTKERCEEFAIASNEAFDNACVILSSKR